MDRDIPTFNRPIIDRIQSKNMQLHQQRLNNIRNSSSYNKQLISTHFKNAPTLKNKKGYLIQQQKKTQIQKQNVLLFNKMMHIMKRPDSNNDVVRTTQTSHLNANNNKLRGSVDISRISQQNKNLFERLEKQKPTISNKKFYQQRKKNLNILKFLGKYPNPNVTQHQFLRSSQATQNGEFNYKRKMNTTFYSNLARNSMNNNKFSRESNGNYQKFRSQIDNFDIQMKQMQQYRNGYQQGTNQNQQRRKFLSQGMNRNQYQKNLQNGSNGNNEQPQQHQQLRESQNYMNMIPSRAIKTSYLVKQKRTLPEAQSDKQQLKSIILYKTKAYPINGQQSQIKFYRHYNQYQINAKMTKNGAQYSLSIPQMQGNQFLSDYDYDYKRIVKMLVIQDGKLVIDIPNQQNQQMHNADQKQKLKFCNQRNQRGIIRANNPKNYDSFNSHREIDSSQNNVIIEDDRTPQFTFKPKENIVKIENNSMKMQKQSQQGFDHSQNVELFKEQVDVHIQSNISQQKKNQKTHLQENQQHKQQKLQQKEQNVKLNAFTNQINFKQVNPKQQMGTIEIQKNMTVNKQTQWGRYQQALDEELE